MESDKKTQGKLKMVYPVYFQTRRDSSWHQEVTTALFSRSIQYSGLR